MQLIQTVKRKSVTRNIIIVLVAIALSAAAGTEALGGWT